MRILFDCWYVKYFENDVLSFNDYVKENHGENLIKLCQYSTLIRGLLLFFAGRKNDLIVTYLSTRGATLLVILEAIFGHKKRRIVFLEFIQTPPENRFFKIIWPLWRKYIYGPSLRCAMAKAHVLTLSEIEMYSKLLGIPKDRFSFIPWPLHFNEQREQAIPFLVELNDKKDDVQLNYVMASGRANVDWETIFAVAEVSDWPLLVVCTSKHLERVNRLNKKGRAKVLHDISQEEHGAYVKAATVYASCLEETFTSVGQVRLMNTIEQGVPVVATKVSGLEGYAIDGVNALLVPPGDVKAIKKSIDSLISNATLRANLVQSAKNFMQERTFTNYINEIKKTVYDLIES